MDMSMDRLMSRHVFFTNSKNNECEIQHINP